MKALNMSCYMYITLSVVIVNCTVLCTYDTVMCYAVIAMIRVDCRCLTMILNSETGLTQLICLQTFDKVFNSLALDFKSN